MPRAQIVVAAAIVASVGTILGAMLVGSWRSADEPFTGAGLPIDETEIAAACGARRDNIEAQATTPVVEQQQRQSVTVGGVRVAVPAGVTLEPDPKAPPGASAWFYSHGAQRIPVAGNLQLAVGIVTRNSPAGAAILAQLAPRSASDDSFGDAGEENAQCLQPIPPMSPKYPAAARASTEVIADHTTMHQRGLLELGDGRLVEIAVDGRADVTPFAEQFATFRAAMESVEPAP